MKKKKPNSHPEPTPPDPNAVRSAVAWILQANRAIDVLNSMEQVFPQLSRNEIEAAIDAAVEEITKAGEEDQEFTRGWCIAATKSIANEMHKIGDYAGALKAIQQVQKLTDC